MGLPEYSEEAEQQKFASNRKKYKHEKGVTKFYHFRNHTQLTIKAGDPILTTAYPKWFLTILDRGEERKRFNMETELCKLH